MKANRKEQVYIVTSTLNKLHKETSQSEITFQRLLAELILSDTSVFGPIPQFVSRYIPILCRLMAPGKRVVSTDWVIDYSVIDGRLGSKIGFMRLEDTPQCIEKLKLVTKKEFKVNKGRIEHSGLKLENIILHNIVDEELIQLLRQNSIERISDNIASIVTKNINLLTSNTPLPRKASMKLINLKKQA